MSAAVLPTWWEPIIPEMFDHARWILDSAKRFQKYSKLTTSQKYALSSVFPLYPITTCLVALHKPALGTEILGKDQNAEYAYLLKLTLERVSWFVRDQQHPYDPGDGRCKLVFSKNDAFPYDCIRTYLNRLRGNRGIYNCSVEWQFIDTDFDIERHKNETGLHLADIAASSLGEALKVRLGIPDDRFVRNLAGTIYRRNGTVYGLKLFPGSVPERFSDSRLLDFLKLL